MKIRTLTILSLVLTLGMTSIILNLNTPVFGFHFGTIKVYSDAYTGGGNSSKPINEFDPVNKEILSGETVKWSNPTAGHPYPHIVTFIGNKSTDLLKSKISNVTKTLRSSDLQSLISDLNKLIESDIKNNKSSQTFNARSVIFPSVINSSRDIVSYLDPNGNQILKGAEYNMTGEEAYLNSGLIWGGGIIPEKFPKINSFMVTFLNPGTYHYQCLIYPDMKGTIVVKPNPGKMGIMIK